MSNPTCLVTLKSPNGDQLRQRAFKLFRHANLLPLDVELDRDDRADAIVMRVVFESPASRGNPTAYARRLCDRLFRTTGPHDTVAVVDLN